jgi:apolipoprotein N-acyltransferase
VVRSANTGISCVIDEYGNIQSQQPWNKAAAIKFNVYQRNTNTLFVKTGDIISIAAVVFTVLLLIWTVYDVIRKKRNHAKTN